MKCALCKINEVENGSCASCKGKIIDILGKLSPEEYKFFCDQITKTTNKD